MLPQVDIYVGELSPFGESLSFAMGSSRSNASGNRIFRHSKPNGGPTFGVVAETNGGEDANHAEDDETQVSEEGWLSLVVMTRGNSVQNINSERWAYWKDSTGQGCAAQERSCATLRTSSSRLERLDDRFNEKLRQPWRISDSDGLRGVCHTFE